MIPDDFLVDCIYNLRKLIFFLEKIHIQMHNINTVNRNRNFCPNIYNIINDI